MKIEEKRDRKSSGKIRFFSCKKSGKNATKNRGKTGPEIKWKYKGFFLVKKVEKMAVENTGKTGPEIKWKIILFLLFFFLFHSAEFRREAHWPKRGVLCKTMHCDLPEKGTKSVRVAS